MQSTPLILGYENYRGQGEPIRLLIEYLGLPWTQKVFSDANSSRGDRAGLKTPFQNLPYLIDGDYAVTEQDAIITYLAQKKNRLDLLGRDNDEVIALKTINEVVDDLHIVILRHFADASTNPNPAEQRHVINHKVAPRIKQISAYLADKAFILGDNLSYGDFKVYELLKLVEVLEAVVPKAVPQPVAPVPTLGGPAPYPGAPPFQPGPPGGPAPVGAPFGAPQPTQPGAIQQAPPAPPKHMFEEFPNIGDYCRRFEAIPQVRGYQNSERFTTRKLLPQYARLQI